MPPRSRSEIEADVWAVERSGRREVEVDVSPRRRAVGERLELSLGDLGKTLLVGLDERRQALVRQIARIGQLGGSLPPVLCGAFVAGDVLIERAAAFALPEPE